MNNLHTHLHTASRKLALSADEKSAMRRELLRTIRRTPVRSPYVSMLFFRGFAAFAIILVVGSGAAFAAEGTVPGDILYSVKTSVTEPLRTALAVSDEQKASWNTSLVERRALEAETLTSEGRLSEADAIELAAHIEASADAAQSAVDKIAATDPSDADAFSVGLRSSLSAHGALISELEDSSKDARTRSAAASISHFFRNWQHGERPTIAAKSTAEPEGGAASSKMAMTLSMAADTSTEESVNAAETVVSATTTAKHATSTDISAQLRASANRSLEAAQDRFEDLRDSLDEATATNIEKRLARIEETLANTTDTRALTRAASDAATLNTFLSTSGKLNRRDLIAPVLEKWELRRDSRDDENDFERFDN